MYKINLTYQGFPKYSLGRFCEYQEGIYDVVTSLFFEQLSTLPPSKFITLDAKYEHRPDLLSYDEYGDTQYWYLIMVYNNIIDIDNFVAGIKLKLFSLEDLEILYQSLIPQG